MSYTSLIPNCTLVIISLILFACEAPGPRTAGFASEGDPVDELTRFLEFPGGDRLAYVDRGEGPATVLLIHDFMRDKSMWDSSTLLSTLLEAGYRVVSVDLPGNGESHFGSFAEQTEINALITLANTLELNAYDVVSYGRGAAVAVQLARADRRLRRAVLGGMGDELVTGQTDALRERIIAFQTGSSPRAELQQDLDYARAKNLDLSVLATQLEVQPSFPKDTLRQLHNTILITGIVGDFTHGHPGRLERLFPNGRASMLPGNYADGFENPVFAAAVMSFLRG